MSEYRRTPQESADNLADRLDVNTAALNRVTRRYRLTMVLLAVMAVTLLTVVKFNYDGAVARCGTGNELRAEISEKFDGISEILDVAGVGDSPEGQDLLMLLSEDLNLRDCGDINWLGQ